MYHKLAEIALLPTVSTETLKFVKNFKQDINCLTNGQPCVLLWPIDTSHPVGHNSISGSLTLANLNLTSCSINISTYADVVINGKTVSLSHDTGQSLCVPDGYSGVGGQAKRASYQQPVLRTWYRPPTSSWTPCYSACVIHDKRPPVYSLG